WEVEPEGRAAPFLAVDEDEAAALLDRSVDHRQPEPGALADPFRREERLEDVALGFYRHAAAGFGDGNLDVVSRHQRRLRAGVRSVDADPGRLDGELSTVGHC